MFKTQQTNLKLVPKKCLFIAIILLLSGSVTARSVGNVVLRSGKTLKKVLLFPDGSTRTLFVHGKGWVREIKPDEILQVTDTLNHDITATMYTQMNLSRIADTLKTLSPDSVDVLTHATQVEKRPYEMGVTISGLLNMPLGGGFYTNLESGVGYGADLRFALGKRTAFKFMVLHGGASLSNSDYQITRGLFIVEFMSSSATPDWKSGSAIYFDAGFGGAFGSVPRSAGQYHNIQLGQSRIETYGSVGILALVANGVAFDVSGDIGILLGSGVINCAEIGLKFGLSFLSGAKRSKRQLTFE